MLTGRESSALASRRTRPKKSPSKAPIDMGRIAAIILGGGEGTRLFPLTLTRCKPAVSFGGRYRLIDVPISNSINSGCHKIFIITQFLSSSLHQHIFRTYRNDIFSSGFVELLPAEQGPSKKGWFQGTADAVRQNLEYLVDTPVDYFLILSGDQLYTMDFQEMVRLAKATGAELVLAALPVEEPEARRMGLVKVNEDGVITEFCEKPQEKKLLDKMAITGHTKKMLKLLPRSRKYLGSMGIYLFKRDALLRLLAKDPRDDFGKHLLPSMIQEGKTIAYNFNGYWEDIGTIGSFYNANMALTDDNPKFNFYDEARPVFATRNNLPGPKITNACIKNSIICEGSIIEADEISHSILGPRTIVGQGSIVRNSYALGSDFYTPPMPSDRMPEQLHIGENCIINKSILDKHVCLGDRVQLVNKQNLDHYDGENIYIRDSIIIVPRGATIPSGFTL